jgi:TetR/AcrR family transcriptional regulator, transcriptional repressor for nem operon
MTLQPKKIEILDFAQELIQKRGYNGFSYADIAEKVGIRKASIHHYFPSKASMGVAVIRRYREIFNTYLATIDKEKNQDGFNRIERYAKLYELVLVENKMCLCGMLASDIETLPRVLKKEIRAFFVDHVTWLSMRLRQHFKKMADQRSNEIAWKIISSLQGAVIMARMSENREIFSSTSRELLLQLEKLT